jgi:hypothetical protein
VAATMTRRQSECPSVVAWFNRGVEMVVRQNCTLIAKDGGEEKQNKDGDGMCL